MADEHYDDMQEEGEYHFSDDQANYDMDIDAASKDAATAVAAGTKESLASKLKHHRRIVMGVLVFIVLLGIVYKLVTPTTNPVTDFQPNRAPVAAKVVAPPPKVIPQQPVVTTVQPPVQVQQPPAAAPQLKVLVDRITVLEQQNAAITNLLQTQYAQKLSDAESENAQLRTQIQELNSRISSMEVTFRQLTKMLSNMRGNSAVSANAASARAAQAKSVYTVQAIIPGRAWLKSDNGDTVTVAEGDVLKDLGRIMKIDPYDGTVDIDTGNKIISLAYGTSGD